MSKIVFFSIAAYGHTNPTIEVVRALTQRGNAVRYYSFTVFRERIEGAGAEFISCDAYIPPLPKDFERRSQYDFSSLIGMATQVTIAMENKLCEELRQLKPDCIVADSMCLWGKLYAQKLNIPMVCSTTSFAVNQHTAKLMKPGFFEMCYLLAGMPKMNKYVKQLRQNGYSVGSVIELVQNDNKTDTIVYSSRAFQPLSETFGEKYAFVGPSLADVAAIEPTEKARPQIYISLGTVVKKANFYQNCIEAFRNGPFDVVMSVRDEKNVAMLQDIPANFTVRASVQQLQVLQCTDVFVTHCGMNSVSESIHFGVPMVMVPQHSEQNMVAQQVNAVGAGMFLKSKKPDDINAAVTQVLENKENHKKNIKKIADSFLFAGGAQKAADKIEVVARQVEQ